jgi:hypothetical protein
MLQDVPFNEIKTLDDVKQFEALYKEVLHIAEFESEVELGVNPKSLDQADVTYLSENDSEYIDKVYKLVSKRLNDDKWLIKTVKIIEERFLASPDSIKGVKYDNELFKGHKGILEDYLKENKKER